MRFNYLNRHRPWLAGLLFLSLCGLLSATSAHAESLKVDFGVPDGDTIGSSPNQVQPSFYAFNANLPFITNPIGDVANETSITRTYLGVSINLQGSLRFFDVPLDYPDEIIGDLVEDGISTGTGGMTITLTGLPAGDYTMITYSHVAYEIEQTPAAQVYVDNGESYVTANDNVPMSYGYEFSPEPSGFVFTSVGSPVTIFMESLNDDEIPYPVYLNGFELIGPLVPEPSSLALACAGAAALGLVRRHRRVAAR